ncbi:MAG: DEAD/DEAH box helicase family protein [Patescibacteria group bacterium]
MILKDYQVKVIEELKRFYTEAQKQKSTLKRIDKTLRGNFSYIDSTYRSLRLDFVDRPENGLKETYPRFCLKVPTGGGKTLIAIEAIREYQNIFAQKRTGLVVWITHRDTIYRQTIEKLRDKNHIYRQWLDQCSGNKTLIIEKGYPLRQQDVEENLVVFMLMLGSANRATKEDLKIFQDSGAYVDFFPHDNQYDQHKKLLEKIPNLDFIQDSLFNRRIVKTSLGNVIRTVNPLIIADEFHTMFSDNAKATINGLNPSMVIGLSATPKERGQMNVLVEITGKELEAENMIKLDMHLHSPTTSGNWQEMIKDVKKKREILEKEALKLNSNKGTYIRPIALIQVERTGSDQRGNNFVHSEDVRDYLIELSVPSFEIAVKSSELDEIKEEKLLSESCEIRYIITKEALKEGWDCSFAYILGVIPNTRTESSMTQLVGRILRQPYAKKTGIKELDESYVYFTKGQTQDILLNIQKGFQQEGLGDLVKNISPESGPTGSRKVKTKIKRDILKKYPESLYLPVWVIKNKNSFRRFSYEIDIRSNINWKEFNYAEWMHKNILPVLNQKKTNYEIVINLERSEIRTLGEEDIDVLETSYLARRITDVVENAFVAFSLAKDFAKVLEKVKDKKKLGANSGFIIQEIVKKLVEVKSQQEQDLFNSLIKEKRLTLAVSSDESVGYSIPKESEIYPEGIEMFNNNLFEKSDKLSMNTLELKVANLIDQNNNVIWWVRNVAENRRWYSVRGWKKGKIRPDFIVAKKGKNDLLELVYVIESKGEHLIDNPDTKYKASVFNKINSEKIEDIGLTLLKFKLNKAFRFELVGENEEDIKINSFFNR